MDIGHTQGRQQMLQERRLAVAGIAKKDHEFDPILFDLLPQNVIQTCFHVGGGGENRIEATRFAVSMARPGVGGEQFGQPRCRVGRERRRDRRVDDSQSTSCAEKRARRSGVFELFALDGRGRALHELGDLLDPHGFHVFPIQTAVLDALSCEVKRSFVEQHMKKTGGQSEEIVARLD